MSLRNLEVQLSYGMPVEDIRYETRHPRLFNDMVMYTVPEPSLRPAKYVNPSIHNGGLYDISGREHHAEIARTTTPTWAKDNTGTHIDFTSGGVNNGIHWSSRPVKYMPLGQRWTLFCRWNLATAPSLSGRIRTAFEFTNTNTNSSTEAVCISVLRTGTDYFHKVSSVGETAGNGAEIQLGTWHSSALVHDGSDLIAYLDGKWDYTVTPGASGWQTSTWLKAGQSVNVTVERWIGKLGHMGAWGRMLLPSEIQLLHDNPNAPLEVKGFDLPLLPAAPAGNRRRRLILLGA